MTPKIARAARVEGQTMVRWVSRWHFGRTPPDSEELVELNLRVNGAYDAESFLRLRVSRDEALNWPLESEVTVTITPGEPS